MQQSGEQLRGRIRLCLSLVFHVLLILVVGGIAASEALAGANMSTAYPAQRASSPSVPMVTATPTACVPAWTIVPSVDPGTTFNYLQGMAAVSANDVWAVGGYLDASANYDTLAEHWNGTAWSVVTTPNQPSLPNGLNAVAAIAPNDVWAVGSYVDDPNSYTLIEHWDGSAWTIVSSPNQNTYDELNAVAATSANDV